MTAVEWRRLTDGMAEPIMEVGMETEDETKGRENADSEEVRERDAAQSEEEEAQRRRQLFQEIRSLRQGSCGGCLGSFPRTWSWIMRIPTDGWVNNRARQRLRLLR